MKNQFNTKLPTAILKYLLSKTRTRPRNPSQPHKTIPYSGPRLTTGCLS